MEQVNREVHENNRSQSQLLEQYKLYLEMADRISQRRTLANSFFLTLHTGVFGLAVSLAGLLSGGIELKAASLAAAVFGFPFVYVWLRVLQSYRQINAAKYRVIHDLEAQLPVAPFDREWDKVDRRKNPKLYTPLTIVEGWVPIAFAFGYLAAAALAVALMLQSRTILHL